MEPNNSLARAAGGAGALRRAYGHVLCAREALSRLSNDVLGESTFANAILLDAAHIFESLGVAPSPVEAESCAELSIEAALACLRTSADPACDGIRRVLVPLQSTWLG